MREIIKKETSLTQKDRSIRLKLCLLFIVVFSAIGFWLMSTLVSQVQDGRASTSWPVALGEITSSEVERTVERRSRSSGGTRREIRYYPRVEYEYEVDGTSYRGVNLSFQTGSGEEYSQQKVSEYPVGKEVEVYYDPAEHDNAVLEPGMNFQVMALTGAIVLVFSLMFFALAYLSFRDFQKVKHARFENGFYYI